MTPSGPSRRPLPSTGSGVDEQGQWAPVFAGQREPFGPGNTAAVRHGGYARLQLSERAAETAEVLRGLAPVKADADEPALQSFAFVVEQLRAASEALEEARGVDRETRLRLSQDARGWTLAALKYAEAFGMTPRARVALGLDLVRVEEGRLTVTRLARMVEDEEGEAA